MPDALALMRLHVCGGMGGMGWRWICSRFGDAGIAARLPQASLRLRFML